MELSKLTSNLQNFFFKALKRFPFTVLYIVLFTFFSINAIFNEIDTRDFPLFLNTLLMGIIFSMLIVVATERKKNNTLNYILNFLLIAILIIYYLTIPENLTGKYFYRLAFIEVSGSIAILFAGFLKNGDNDDYWSYNFRAFEKFLIAYVYAFVLQMGLFIAFELIDLLFHTNSNFKFNSSVSILSYVFFAGTLYLSMFPKYNQEKIENYPKVLQVLVFYILIPLVIIYFVILYVYFFKILASWQMPEGIVSYMVLTFSGLGILTLMAIYPVLKVTDKYKFVKQFSRYFFYMILPLLVLLFMAIFIRIKNYGITENRYYVVVLALWLAFVSIYSIINKFSKIIYIPASFVALMLLVSFGPWSSFNVAKHNQLKRLDKILTEHKAEQDSLNFINLNDSLYSETYSIVKYLTKTHGIDVLNKKYNLDISDTLDSYYAVDEFFNKMNINKISDDSTVTYYSNDYRDNYLYFYGDYEKPLNITGYDYFYKNFKDLEKYEINDSVSIKFDLNKHIVKAEINEKEYKLDISNQLEKIIKNKPKQLIIVAEDPDIIKIEYVIYSLNAKKEENGKITFTYISADAFIKIY